MPDTPVDPPVVTPDGAPVVPDVEPVPPTQTVHPWRATARTVFAGILGFLVILPIVTSTAGLDPDKLPWLAGVLAVAAAVTRVMALPQVDDFLRKFVPFLAARPAEK